MSSVTQVKFEIKPSAKKSVNTTGKSTGESIGKVARVEVKQIAVGIKSTAGNNSNVKSEKFKSFNAAAGNSVTTEKVFNVKGAHDGKIVPVKSDSAIKSDLAVKTNSAAENYTALESNSAVRSNLAARSNSAVRNDSVVKRSESKRLGISVNSAARQSDSIPVGRSPVVDNSNPKPLVKINSEKRGNEIPKSLTKSESVWKEKEEDKKFGINEQSKSSQENVPSKFSKPVNILGSKENGIKRANNLLTLVEQSSDRDKGVNKVKQDGDEAKIEVTANSGSFIGSTINSGKVSLETRDELNSTKITSRKQFKVSTNGNVLNDNIKELDGTSKTFDNKPELKKKSGLENNVKLDTRNELDKAEEKVTAEKKISNPMREMMLTQALKDEIIKKGNALSSGKGSTMDLEKKMDLGEESVQDENVVEISVKGDKTKDDDDEPIKIVEPANMIDELQKYLLKRFGPVVNNIQETKEIPKFDAQESKTDKDIKQSEAQTKTELSVKTDSNENQPETLNKKAPISPNAVLPHPIFFKTSIKKDPGSKLHDQLLKELGSVLRKKEGKDDEGKSANKENEGDDNDDDGKGLRKFPKRRVSAKGNKILGNKALLANLENQLQRTLHKNKIFQRQKLKVVDLETIEVNDSQSVSSVGKDDGTETEVKSGAKLILDTEQLHKHDKEEDDNVMSAINQLDMSISEASSQNTSRQQPNLVLPASGTYPAKVTGNNESDNQEIFVYAFENKRGNTEGVICSVEKRVSMNDSRGRPRKYLTCINIVAEKDAVIDEGCPFTQDIADGGLPSASGSGLFFAEEDKPAVFNVEVGRRKGDLRVSVSGPNSIAKCSVDPQDDGSYTVTYIPVETGIFDISVTWNSTDIPGSPYHPKVVDARKVRIIGGWQHFMDSNERVNLVVGERKQLPFDISEAGPGTLRAEVKGPSKSLDVDIDTHTMGRGVIEFVPEEEGTHYIHIFWSDIPLVNSPFLGFAVQHTPDASKLILTGRGLKEAVVREEAEFIIDGSQAGRGNPDVVLSGVRAEVNVKIFPIGNGKFRCTYIPILPGAYLLHITWNGRQLRGSPYKVNVIGAFYPNRVVVNGVGGAILGREMNVGIDTRKAGPGELTAYCMGPHQVAQCELDDNHDGTFRLGVKAQEPGRHVLQIKYGGEHVQGSPFVYKVTAQPDASKVRVHGPGVEHGILATYISRFIVETRGAGAGQLTVRIRGPKGAFQVEMYRDSQRDRTILCRFDPTECGLYIISVKWSGVDVPGSPFHVHILDTQEELEQVLNEVSYSFGTSHSHGGSLHSSQNPPPRLVYGQWREKI